MTAALLCVELVSADVVMVSQFLSHNVAFVSWCLVIAPKVLE